MSDQGELFGGAEGRRRRDRGRARPASRNAAWLGRARAVAQEISEVRGRVCADDVRRVMTERDDLPDHPNAWGSLFSGRGWVVLEVRHSVIPSRHAGLQRVWRWEG